jgi:hypothetical protein
MTSRPLATNRHSHSPEFTRLLPPASSISTAVDPVLVAPTKLSSSPSLGISSTSTITNLDPRFASAETRQTRRYALPSVRSSTANLYSERHRRFCRSILIAIYPVQRFRILSTDAIPILSTDAIPILSTAPNVTCSEWLPFPLNVTTQYFNPPHDA